MKKSDIINNVDSKVKITVSYADDDNEVAEGSEAGVEREVWSNKIEFFLSCVSFAVGLGNIWRFPYLCYRNGGGAFLIPYVCMLGITGLPLFFFELCLGQYGREGPITIWKVVPLLQGLGFGMFIIASFIALYYNVIIAWALFYLFSSFTATLPWTSCDNWWNSDACKRFDSKNCTLHDGVMDMNGTCFSRNEVTEHEWQALSNASLEAKLPADEFFHNFMLDISDGFHDEEGHHLQWRLCLCLMLAWTIVCLALFKGVSGMGKAVYFTGIFPYVVLCILFVRAITLPGSINGILFYVTPKWERLLNIKVWADAAMQIFFSLGPCWGGLITLASYNKFNNNCLRDAFLISLTNCLTSFFAGFVIFGIVGYMAYELGVEVEDVAAQGAGLAFVAYPEAVARLPISPLWSILFFVMLLTLGLGTQLTTVQTVITSIVDTFNIRHKYKHVCCGVCIALCCLGMSMCSKNGMYILQLLDNYSGTYSALMIGCGELIAISWIYGIDNFFDDIKLMLGSYPFPMYYWRAMWKFLTPISVFVILVLTFVFYTPSSYANYDYPPWADALGWFISFGCVMAVPIRAVILISRQTGTLGSRIRKLTIPTADWGHIKTLSLPNSAISFVDSQTDMTSQGHELNNVTTKRFTNGNKGLQDSEDENGRGLYMKVSQKGDY